MNGVETVHAAQPRVLGVVRRAAVCWLRHPRLAALSGAAIVLQQLFLTAFALSLKLIIDDVSGKESGPSTSLVVTLLLVGFVVMAFASLGGERVNARMGVLITSDVRRRLHKKLQSLSADFFAGATMGDVLTRFTADVKSIETGYTQGFLKSCVVFVSLLMNVPILFVLDWRLGLITSVTLPVLFVIVGWLLPRSIAASRLVRSSETAVTNDLQEAVRAQQIVRAFLLEPVMSKHFDDSLEQLGEATVRSRFTMALISKLLSLGVLFVELLVLVIGAKLVLDRHLEVSSLISFMTILATVSDRVAEYLKEVMPVLIDSAGGIGHVEEFLDLPIGVADAADAVEVGPLRTGIQFDHVGFDYQPGHKILDDVTLSIPAGQSVVFVGESGSGKSTVLSLLMRFYDAKTGSVSIDGCDIRRTTQGSLRSQMSVVFQESFLFNTTVRENIRLGRPGATDRDVEEAARLAEIHDLITSLPMGYDTLVGEAGGRLSGGQRQRIAIARAIVRDPRILLLDEATSALDPGVEAAINETLARLSKDRTVVSVTHRLSSAVGADRIFVMHAGRLVEEGSHESLLRNGGPYARLWRKQSGFDVRKDGRFATVEAERLREIDLFSNFDHAVLQEIASSFYPEHFEAGRDVIVEGDRGDKFYLIVRGQVAINTRDSSGVSHLLRVSEEGDHFGDMALLTDLPRNATVTTIKPCLLLAMAKADMLSLIERFPEIGRELRARMPVAALASSVVSSVPSTVSSGVPSGET